MQNRSSGDNICYDQECSYNQPWIKPHKHNANSNGGWVTYIVEKPKQKVHNNPTDLDQEL